MAGGAIYLFRPGDLTISRCIFNRNEASYGSALYYEESNDEKTLVLSSSTFHENFALENGGALYIPVSFFIIIENCHFLNNKIQNDENSQKSLGSVLFLNNPGNLSLNKSSFISNVGILGACIYYSETSKKITYLKI